MTCDLCFVPAARTIGLYLRLLEDLNILVDDDRTCCDDEGFCEESCVLFSFSEQSTSSVTSICGICSKLRMALTVVISSGISKPSSVLHSGQGVPQLKQTGKSTNQGKVDGSFKAYAWSLLG